LNGSSSRAESPKRKKGIWKTLPALIVLLPSLSACLSASPAGTPTPIRETTTPVPTLPAHPLLTPTLYPPAIPSAPEREIDASQNILKNPGFEDSFDGWWYGGDPVGAVTRIDSATAHSGAKSLRIDFDGGEDLDYWHISQSIPVEPNTTYCLQGYLRVEGIRAFSSIRLAVQDGRPNGWEKLYVSTADLYATQGWTPVSAAFTTLPDTGSVLVLATRSGMGGRFPIGGTVWVDDVALVRLPPVITPGRLTMHVGDVQEVGVGNGDPPYAWTSSNPSLAAVRPSGDGARARVEALAEGTIEILSVDAEGRTGRLELTAIGRSAVTVNVGRVFREVPETMFGNNVQYYFTSRYIPDHPTWDLVLDDPVFLSDVAELGLTSLRYPGGMEANYYDFSSGKGWISWMGDSEQFHVDDAEGGVDTARFIQFLRDAGIPDAVITANVYKSGNKLWPEDNWISSRVAAGWVEYTNRVLGFDVKYWELGNEVTASDEFPWAGDPHEDGLQVPGLTRDMYIRKIREWSRAMKAVDPTIRVGAVALETPRGGGVAEWWTLPILQDRADDIDFLIVHPYVNVGPYLEDGRLTDHSAAEMYAWIWATDPVARLRRWIDSAAPARASDIGIQASEWSIYTAGMVPKGNDSLLNAVLSTDLFWDMVQEGVDGANLFLLCDAADATLEPVSGGRKYAQYHMLWMNRRRSGKWLVESRVDSPTYSAGPFGGVDTMDYVKAVDGVPYLSAYATLSEDGSRLYLIVTNKSAKPELTAVNLNGFRPYGEVSVWQMTSANWDDTGVQPVATVIRDPDSPFVYTFPARSVTSLVFNTQ
jgi:alpha-L-arabinofuranosidase